MEIFKTINKYRRFFRFPFLHHFLMQIFFLLLFISLVFVYIFIDINNKWVFFSVSLSILIITSPFSILKIIYSFFSLKSTRYYGEMFIIITNNKIICPKNNNFEIAIENKKHTEFRIYKQESLSIKINEIENLELFYLNSIKFWKRKLKSDGGKLVFGDPGDYFVDSAYFKIILKNDEEKFIIADFLHYDQIIQILKIIKDKANNNHKLIKKINIILWKLSDDYKTEICKSW